MKIDASKIQEILKEECITCNTLEKIKCKNRCSNCPFISDGGCRTSSKLKKYGIRKMYKHHFYYFLHHPELNWEYPENEKINNKNIFWIIHHIDRNHNNNNKNNLVLILNNEHSRIHCSEDLPTKKDEVKRKIGLAHKKLYKENKRTCPTKDPEIAKKVSASLKRRVLTGEHNFLTNNPSPNNIKNNNLIEYLKTIKQDIIVNESLAKMLGYKIDYKCGLYEFERVIKNTIQKNNLSINCIKRRIPNSKFNAKEMVISPKMEDC